MRIASNSTRGTIGFNMTPMIDVVFLLIIFFLVSSHLAQQEVQLAIDLPDASSGDRPEEENVRRIVVNVLPDRQIAVGTEIVAPARLESLLKYEQEKTRRTGAAPPGGTHPHRPTRPLSDRGTDPAHLRPQRHLECQVRRRGEIEVSTFEFRHSTFSLRL